MQNSEAAPKELPGLVFIHGVGLALMDTGQLVSDENKFSVQSSESKNNLNKKSVNLSLELVTNKSNINLHIN